MHVYFYNYEYWEGDREMVGSGVVKGENVKLQRRLLDNARMKEEKNNEI